jgi:hypothetical protein
MPVRFLSLTDTLMQIGQEALLTEKALPDVVSVWDHL